MPWYSKPFYGYLASPLINGLINGAWELAEIWKLGKRLGYFVRVAVWLTIYLFLRNTVSFESFPQLLGYTLTLAIITMTSNLLSSGLLNVRIWLLLLLSMSPVLSIIYHLPWNIEYGHHCALEIHSLLFSHACIANYHGKQSLGALFCNLTSCCVF